VIKHAAWSSAVSLFVAAAVGCQGNRDQQVLEEPPTVFGDENVVAPRPIIVEGCLTASGNRFVLTELDRGAPGPKVAEQHGERPWAEAVPTTEAYRLVGMEEQLRPLVGQRIEITGAAEPEDAAATSGADPQVSTLQSTRIEISDLQVRSVNANGEKCQDRL
jgi:hypothetical protein